MGFKARQQQVKTLAAVLAELPMPKHLLTLKV